MRRHGQWLQQAQRGGKGLSRRLPHRGCRAEGIARLPGLSQRRLQHSAALGAPLPFTQQPKDLARRQRYLRPHGAIVQPSTARRRAPLRVGSVARAPPRLGRLGHAALAPKGWTLSFDVKEFA